jgi:hypothetical protein
MTIKPFIASSQPIVHLSFHMAPPVHHHSGTNCQKSTIAETNLQLLATNLQRLSLSEFLIVTMQQRISSPSAMTSNHVSNSLVIATNLNSPTLQQQVKNAPPPYFVGPLAPPSSRITTHGLACPQHQTRRPKPQALVHPLHPSHGRQPPPPSKPLGLLHPDPPAMEEFILPHVPTKYHLRC